jgi:hypothetical protein
MSKPTKKQIMESHAVSFAMLLEELKFMYSFIEDVYNSDHEDYGV